MHKSLARLLGPAYTPEIHFRKVHGGDINEVHRIVLPDGNAYLFKWHPNPPAGFFAAEAAGLQAIAEAEALRVPDVIATDRHGLLMEWLIGTDPHTDTVGIQLGRGLAKMHRVTADAFGFAQDNFVGLLPQQNPRLDSWIEFYRDFRLGPQLMIAEKRGHLSPTRRKFAGRMLDRLDLWIDNSMVVPSLIHGDLWSGNWIATREGPALIDPAVSFADREMDLAMTALFGGFSDAFYQAYEEALPPSPGHEERRPLYQLYYLLIHLNIFGETYGPAVDNILNRYGQ